MSDLLPHELPIATDQMTKHLVNIAPEFTQLESEPWVVIVDSVILILTIIGALFILGGMAMNEIRKRASTTRMRLVQSLIITDVILGVVGLIGCALTLDGHPLKIDTPSCDGLGVLFHAVIFSQHCWTLTLAFSTFMILTKPLHTVTSWIEKYWIWLWPVVWGISFAVSVVTYLIYGYEPAGGICYLGNNTGLYGELIQFLPRAIVFLFITFFYGRLYVFLRRPDKIRSGLSDKSAGESSYSKMKHSWMRSSRSRVPFLKHRQTKTVLLNDDGERIGIDTGVSHHTASHSSHTSIAAPEPRPPPIVVEKPLPESDSKPAPEPYLAKLPYRAKSPHRAKSPDPDIPPWERIELPVFQIDGQKYGGSSTPAREHNWAEWRFTSRRGRSATPVPPVDTAAPTPATSPLTSPIKESFDRTLPKSITPTSSTFDKSSQPSPAAPSFTSAALHTFNKVGGSNCGSDAGYSSTPTAVESEFSRRPSQASGSSLPGSSDVVKPLRVFTREGPSPMDSFNPEERRPSLPNIDPEPIVSSWRRPSYCPPLFRPAPRAPPALAPNDTVTEADLEKGFIVVEEDETLSPTPADDDQWDLKRFLDAEPAPGGDDPFVVTQRSENVEYVAESMASYLNRKTALLMLWFPLGYLVLFSVSLIQIIYDFVGNPPGELRAISRWMIFGQGLLNGIIYGVVEWHTKRVVRRRVRRGTFSPRTSQHSSHHLAGLQALRHPIRYYHEHHPHHSHPHAHSHSHSHHKKEAETGASQIASRRSPQVSFADPESSIMQRLDLKDRGPTLDEY